VRHLQAVAVAVKVTLTTPLPVLVKQAEVVAVVAGAQDQADQAQQGKEITAVQVTEVKVLVPQAAVVVARQQPGLVIVIREMAEQAQTHTVRGQRQHQPVQVDIMRAAVVQEQTHRYLVVVPAAAALAQEAVLQQLL